MGAGQGKSSWGLTFKQSPENKAKIQQMQDERGMVWDCWCLLRLEHKVNMDVF